MRTHLNDLQSKLLVAPPRQHAPADTVPAGFERRVMNRLPAAPALDHWCQWGNAMLRAASACAVIAILLGVWACWPHQEYASATLEDTVFAAAEELSETW